MLQLGASVNMYMFEGGTNFGYWNGADFKVVYKPVTTSYDYDAPFSETGDPTDKLYALINVISKFKEIPAGPMPPATIKQAYGTVSMRKDGELLSFLDILSPYPPVKSVLPLTFEQLNQYCGFMLYRTVLPANFPEPTPLTSPKSAIHDLAYVMVNWVYVGVLERDNVEAISITGRMGDRLDVLVESMGHINFGAEFNDFKGLLRCLLLGPHILEDWEMYPLKIDEAVKVGWVQAWPQAVAHEKLILPSTGPTFYSATFKLPGPNHDTFIKLPHWTKGQIWINGFNIGRYWPARGPQKTLYVPASLLDAGRPNNVTVLELIRAPEKPWVVFLDHPILNGSQIEEEKELQLN